MLDHLGQLPNFAAKKFGDKEALNFENRSFSFIQINSLVENLASNLKNLGIKEKDVITLYASNSWEWIISYFGIARVGAVINPVNTMLTPNEIKYVVNDCKAKAIITTSEKVSQITDLKEEGQINFIISFGDIVEGSISFNDLVNICNSKKEVELKYELETNVNLINFKNGYIEISFNENLKKDFVKILSSKLYEWTNARWIISLSQNKGQETIKKTSEEVKKNNLKDFEQTDIFNNIKKSFPDAELIDVKDNKDD